MIDDVAAGYPSDRYAIQHVSFQVTVGERVAVIGPNGAGKSTLFKALVGLLPFTTGSVSIHGEDCRTSHNLVGYVPQHNEIDWNFPATVRDVVMMGRARQIGWLRFPGKRDWALVHERLAQVGMDGYAHRQIGQLSGGQKRRVFIARALAQNADVLLLDEPFSGVDANAEQEIMQTLDLLKAAHVTVILATHDMQMALTQFDKLLLLKGTVIGYGTPSEVFTPDTLRAAYGGRVSVWQDAGQTLILADEHGCC
ncbi:MAG: metal ABC transporter ATP-binding protein [Armatimonadetes bacterium]|nr:metal ABC transporter ATP-binding protein [Anaerolineae bacterium]